MAQYNQSNTSECYNNKRHNLILLNWYSYARHVWGVHVSQIIVLNGVRLKHGDGVANDLGVMSGNEYYPVNAWQYNVESLCTWTSPDVVSC